MKKDISHNTNKLKKGIISNDSFSEFLRNSYVQVADEYKAEAEIWKQFLK